MKAVVMVLAAIGVVAIFVFALYAFAIYKATQPGGMSFPTIPEPPSKVTTEDTETVDSNLEVGSEENDEKKAAFAIFTNGTFRVFTAPMYHNLSKDVFIESTNPNIVRITKVGITWDDFFTTLPFKLTTDCLTTGTGQTFCNGQNGTLKFYLNGQSDPDALDKLINQGDKLLISFGNETDSQIQTQIEKIPDPNL